MLVRARQYHNVRWQKLPEWMQYFMEFIKGGEGNDGIELYGITGRNL